MSSNTTIQPDDPNDPNRDVVADVEHVDPADAHADADRPEAPERPLTLDEQRERAREALQGGDTGTDAPA